MIKTHSDDPDVEQAANVAYDIIEQVLGSLPAAETFDYGGHDLQVGEYEVCSNCTKAIAEAQQAKEALQTKAGEIEDTVIKEHLNLAADLFQKEAEAAIIRAKFHNGKGTEKILNTLLGFQFDRKIQEDYQHSHHQGE
ncbi:MAG TPA: hypothetical protein VIH90_01065 [Candidatus Saccharimonadales bacterium]